MMQRAALAIAEHLGEFDDTALAGSEELLAGELRGCTQVKPGLTAVRGRKRGGEGVQMGLVTRQTVAARRSRPRRNPGR